MKLNKISADMVSRRPDQTAEWLNRLARQVDIVESEALSGSKKTSDLPIATTYSLGVVKIGQNLSITPEGVLSALSPSSYNYELLFNKPKINNVELIGNKSLHDLGIDIPTKTSELLNNGSDNTSVYVELDELATVATSGSYADLLNKPTIGNATLTIQKNSTNVGTFTANATSNETIDISVPTQTSDIINNGADGTSTYVEADELATVATSGSYADLLNKPTIGNATLTIQKNGTSAGTFTANATSNETINITVPTTAADVGALPDSTKYAANLSLTIDSSTFVVTGQLKDQDGNNIGNSQTIDLPLESVVVNGSYDSATKEVVLTLQNGNTIRFSVADLVSGLQTEITSNNPLNADLVDDSTSTNKFVTASDISKLNGIQAGAEVNVQADWNEADSSSDAYIENKPTIGNATLTIQRNGNTAQTFTANATSNKTVDIQAPKRVSLTGQIQLASWRHSVIALCQVSTTDSATLSSYSDGDIIFHRGNGLNGMSEVHVAIENQYGNAYYTNFYYYGNIPLISPGANIDTAKGFRPCTFKYNNVWYGGIELCIEEAQLEQVYFDGESNFAIFGLDYYSNPHTASGTTYPGEVLNQEVYDSLNYTQWAYKNKGVFRTNMANLDTGQIMKAATYTATLPDKNGTVAMTSDIEDATLTIEQNGTTAGTFTANASSNTTISLTDTTYSDFTGASSGTAGAAGLVPAPAAGDDTKYLSGDGLWKTVSQYSLPIATANDLGGIKVGSRLTINSTTGVLSADSQTDNNFTTTLKDKLDGIAAGAEVNVQSDWTEADNTSDAYIKNKPSLATVATSGSYNDLTNKPTIPAAQVNSDWDANSGVAQILNKPSLATVATSGSYNDLTNKPTIPTVNNATLTIQKNGTDVQTFTANQATNATANISVPTKTSDITNDSGFITAGDLQDLAVQEGSTQPVFDDMTPIKTFTWTVADTTYRPVYQFDNTGWAYDNMDMTVAYRITVTGSGISQVTDIIDRWFSPTSWPVTSIMARTLSTSAATTGYRYLRAVFPNSSGLNNNTYKFGQEISNYNSTSRTIQVDVFKTATGITWNETKPAGPIYTDSTYQATNAMQPYATRGWMFRSPSSFNANSADAATRVSSYESATVGSSAIKSGATALVASHLGFQATDGLVYDISDTAKNMVCDENAKIGYISNNINANTAIDSRYLRPLCNLGSTAVGYIPHATIALGDRVYLRCTMDSSGNIHSDNYLATSMAPGYTWVPFGTATASNTIYMDVRKPTFYTLNSAGKLTHINGKETVPDITVTNTDPGEGVSLGEDEYIAVYGSGVDVPNFTLTNVDPGEGSPLDQDDYLAVYGSPNNIPASEIDWSTFQGSASMPIYTSEAISLGPFSARIHRIGNFCFTCGSNVLSSWPSGNRVDTNKTLPVGFTPVNESIITCINIDGQYSDNVSTLTLRTDREIWRSSGHSITSATRIDYSGFWVTTDAWPS